LNVVELIGYRQNIKIFEQISFLPNLQKIDLLIDFYDFRKHQ
jgi:hypothetical protein